VSVFCVSSSYLYSHVIYQMNILYTTGKSASVAIN